MNNYNKYNDGKIYIIKCHTNPFLIYVGQTVQTINKRFQQHKRDANYYCSTTLHKNMDEFGIENFYIELYKNCNCNNKEELTKEEIKTIRDLHDENNELVFLNENYIHYTYNIK